MNLLSAAFMKRVVGIKCSPSRMLLIMLFGLVLCPFSAIGQCTSTWSLGANGSWNTGTNWTPSGVPTGSSNTCINAANTAVTVGGGSTSDLTLGLGTDSLTITDNTTLTINGPTISNAGSIILNSAGDTTELSITGSTSLTGGGALTLSNNVNNYILGGGTLTNQETIQGAGYIGDANLTLVNSGAINANQSNVLTINPNGGTTNTGTLEATAGGTLLLVSYPITNTGGTILASGAGSTVDIDGVSVTGGTLTTTSSGIINTYGGSTLTGVTISTGSNVLIPDNTDASYAGTITNNGTITINSGGDTTELLVAGSTTLTGTGTVTMSNNTNNYIFGGGTLTNKQTIQGAGIIGDADLTLINSGTIDANQSQALTMNPNGGTTNTGTLEATAGGTLVLETYGVTNTGGTILASGAGSTVDIAGGSITGGTLTTNSGGIINTYGDTTLTGLTISGGTNVFIPDNNSAAYAGTITNNGTITINSVGDTTEFLVTGSTTLTGTGKVTMSNAANNYILGGGTLTNQETIQGAGYIGDANLTLVNSAIIDANQSNVLTVNPNGGTTNTGTLEATAGGTLLLLSYPVANTGGTILASGTGSTVDIDAATITGGTLTTASSGIMNAYGNAVLNGVTLSAGSTLNLLDNNNALFEGTITNNGNITIGSGGDTTEFLTYNGPVTLTGGGTVTLSDNNNNYIFASSTGGALTNVNNTISGSGNIGDTNMAFTNDSGGLVNASSAHGNGLAIDTSVFGTTNLGTMEASSGGTLVIESTSVANTNGTTSGTLKALSGGVVDLSTSTISGGNLTTVGTGVINAYGNSLLDGLAHTITLTSGSSLVVPDNSTASFQGTFTNNGTVTIGSAGDTTIFQVAPGQNATLTGSGTVTMSNNVNNYILAASGAASTLTNQETIQGAGYIGDASLTLVNSSTIDANQSHALTINPNGGTTNTGTLEATAGGTLVLLNYGVTNTGGQILSSGTGSTVDIDAATITGGTLTTASSGIMNAYGNAVLNGVTLSAGSTLNLLDNNTVYFEGTITNSGTINLASGGDTTELSISGNTTLAGKGKLVLSDNTNNYILGTGTLTNQSTIEGAGNLGDAQIGLVNTGSILANEKTASTLVIDTNGTGFSNSSGATNGILNVSAKNTVVIEGGPFTNFSAGTLTGGTYMVTGTLEFAAGSTGIVTNSANITLTGATAGILNTSEGNASALSGFTTNGSKGAFTVNAATFTDANVFTNSGTLAVGSNGKFNASNQLTNFNNSISTLTGGSYTMTGTGQLQFNNQGDALDIVTNDARITLSGVDTTKSSIIDQTGANALANFTTNGSTGSLTLSADRNFTTTGSMTNAGSISVQKSTGSGTTALIIGGTGNFTQTGGSTTVDGLLTTAGAIDISGGFVYGNGGTLTGAFDLTGGTVNPGDGLNKIGVLNITGSYAETGGTLNVDLDGTTSGKFDVLNISGAAALGGTLNVDALTGFVPTAGEQFDILNYGSETGTFASVKCTFSNGDGCSVTYNGTDAVLTITAAAATTPATHGSVSTTVVGLTKSSRVMSSFSNNLSETPAVLAPALPCSGFRAIASLTCLSKEFFGSPATAITSAQPARSKKTPVSSMHRDAAATFGVGPAIGEVSLRTSSTSNSSSATLARVYFCAYAPSALAHSLGCRF